MRWRPTFAVVALIGAWFVSGERDRAPATARVADATGQWLVVYKEFVSDLVVASSDGSSDRVLVGNTERIRAPKSPVWSRDGKRIAVETDGGVWAMRADGRKRRRVEPIGSNLPGHGLAPMWSPDGRWLAFTVAWNDDEGEWPGYPGDGVAVFVARSDGSGQLRRLRQSVAFPTWSPDGRRIAVATGKGGIAVMRSDGSRLRVLRRKPAFRTALSRVEFSPAGRMLLLAAGFPQRLKVFNLRTRRLLRLPRSMSIGDIAAATWTPGGRRIAFLESDRIYYDNGGYRPGATRLVTVRPDGTGRHVLANLKRTAATGAGMGLTLNPAVRARRAGHQHPAPGKLRR